MNDSNYWNMVKQEYKDSEITKELYSEWIKNSDCRTMVQIYIPKWNRSVGIPAVHIPSHIKIHYDE